jgi:hypothetical protein
LGGPAYATSHTLTAYVTKPLHVLGVIDLQLDGWASREEAAQFAWDPPTSSSARYLAAGKCRQA